ncbi:MAG: ribonuclease Y [Clostridiales bacterium]|nr:ribonuclease Y [Clostridiales bacterium]
MTLLCASTAFVLAIVLPIVAVIVGAFVGLFVDRAYQNKKRSDAKQAANKMLEDAVNEVKEMRKTATREAREELAKERSAQEKELREKQAGISRSEQRIIQREETLDKKEQLLDKKSDDLDAQKATLAQKHAEADKLKAELAAANSKILEEIQRVAGMSKDEAKSQLIDAIRDEAKHDAAKMVRDIDAEAKEEADKRAQKIVALAVQRCAVDHSSEITVSTVALPNDEMKGRIIGREGRNIRALETATGCDLIIDDTPEAVVLSCFDPIRREVARIALEKLISDGRIHPGRIEDLVEKAQKEVDVKIKEAGENAMYETGVFGLNPELAKILGRLRFRTSYGQNVLRHSIEASHLAGIMAAELGANVPLCKRAGLLHDIGKALDHELEGTHVSIGVDVAKKYKESKEVIHCIAAHHNDVDPETIEAVIVQCADAISGARPGARRESLDNYVKRLEKLEEIANGFEGVEKSFAVQAGREIRIIVKPEVVDDVQAMYMSKEIAKQIEQDMQYPGQIKVNVIRETRAVEYAK